MAVRDDITVRWDLSPRIVFVAAPSTNVTIQDLYDTLRDLEDEPPEMIYPSIISAAGKEDLGGGVSVGLTATLQNAVLAFEGRKLGTSSGTVTTADATGRVLTDSAATFITDGVVPGAWVVNQATGASATVLTVDSETQLTTDILEDGTDNEFGLGDDYKIWVETQCRVDGGNLVAVDENQNTISPILPTAGTQVVLTSSSSATLTDRALITEAKYLIEGLRQSHGAVGTSFYWDPVGGNDSNTGLLPEQALATFAAAQAKTVAGRHDAIFIVTQNATGTLTITERINITTDALILRGFGGVLFAPLDDAGPTITVAADHVECSGIGVMSSGVTPQPAIHVTGAVSCRLQDIRVTGASGVGVLLENSSAPLLDSVLVSNTGDDGLRFDDVTVGLLRTCKVSMATGYGVSLIATTPGDTVDVSLAFCGIHDNTLGSVSVGTGVVQTLLQNTVVLDQELVDNGLSTRDFSALGEFGRVA